LRSDAGTPVVPLFNFSFLIFHFPVPYHARAMSEALHQVVRKHWGYDSLRPLQLEAMEAMLARRDSLVILPTGGGKSLCYQAPALLREGLTVVVSPLIALMKDQVDALRECGVAATQLNSSQDREEQRRISDAVRKGEIKLLFVSPERRAVSSFQKFLSEVGVVGFAIDEAHCISHWGHDFRPEYRALSRLHELYPDVSIHAFTATATEKVRRDIVEQLALRDPLLRDGSFDRPNLLSRVTLRPSLL
jgi:ATP-dependent DNA helicase RecQ